MQKPEANVTAQGIDDRVRVSFTVDLAQSEVNARIHHLETYINDYDLQIAQLESLRKSAYDEINALRKFS